MRLEKRYALRFKKSQNIFPGDGRVFKTVRGAIEYVEKSMLEQGTTLELCTVDAQQVGGVLGPYVVLWNSIEPKHDVVVGLHEMNGFITAIEEASR